MRGGRRTKSQTLGEAGGKTGCTVLEAPQVRRWLGRCKAGGLGHWDSFLMEILEASTWGIPEHLHLGPLLAVGTQGTVPPALAEGLCGDNSMCHLRATPHTSGHPPGGSAH